MSSSPSASSVDILELDGVDLNQLKKTAARREACARHLPKVALVAYLAYATIATVLCVTTFRPAIERLSVSLLGSPAAQESTSFQVSADRQMSDIRVFDHTDIACPAQFVQCGSTNPNDFTSWCCNQGQTCGSTSPQCNGSANPDSIGGPSSAVLTLIIGIIIAIWFGPLIIYLVVIAIVRFGQVGRFDSLAKSGRYEHWVVVSGCFAMSIDSSSGDADFNQAAFNLVNQYGGCGDECLMHCVGVWFCSTCYPCCMCCVSASRNQSKVGTLQSALRLRGYNTNVQFLSAIIPACCNAMFIGLVNKTQPAGVVLVTTATSGMVVAQSPGTQLTTLSYVQPQYGQPQPQYSPQAQYGQPQYAQPQYAQAGVSYAAPAYAPAVQPPEVVKPTI